ncbi:endonuclease III [Candidatus Peregrinibacteria bacterium]|nr:endonuclease III [Candidatus Peregrinibacteria bacterium]
MITAPKAKKIIAALEKLYPNPKPSLKFKTPFESLVATVLSAQCTDARVNIVTARLFKAADTPEKILKLGEKRLEIFVRPTGFFRVKTKNLIAAAKMIVEKFGGRVPSSLENLQRLPGVGRKTASVILAQAFKIPAFPVDRHIFRVANRLGLANAKTAEETDFQLRKNILEKFWIHLHLQLIYHGRLICRPKPKCRACALLKWCSEGQKFKFHR